MWPPAEEEQPRSIEPNRIENIKQKDHRSELSLDYHYANHIKIDTFLLLLSLVAATFTRVFFVLLARITFGNPTNYG